LVSDWSSDVCSSDLKELVRLYQERPTTEGMNDEGGGMKDEDQRMKGVDQRFVPPPSSLQLWVFEILFMRGAVG